MMIDDNDDISNVSKSKRRAERMPTQPPLIYAVLHKDHPSLTVLFKTYPIIQKRDQSPVIYFVVTAYWLNSGSARQMSKLQCLDIVEPLKRSEGTAENANPSQCGANCCIIMPTHNNPARLAGPTSFRYAGRTSWMSRLSMCIRQNVNGLTIHAGSNVVDFGT